MRFVRALLFVTLTGSLAFAEEAAPPASSGNTDAKPAETAQASDGAAAPTATAATKAASKGKVPLRVVKMLPESNQVLLFDKNRGTHVVAEAGQDVDGYIVDEIDDDEVTLVAPNGAEIILTAPDMAWRRRAAERKAAVATKKSGAPATEAGAAPMDPYADAAPADPYGDEASMSSAGAASSGGSSSSMSSGGGTVGVASAAGVASTGGSTMSSGSAAATGTAPATAPGTAPATVTVPATGSTTGTAPAATATAPGAPSAQATPTPTPTPTPAGLDAAGADLGSAVTGTPGSSTTTPTTFTLARADVDAALGDFGATAVTFDAKFVANGLRIDSIAPGTILAKAGLQKGDTVTAVDGQPLRSFDDAATLYARMGTAKSATVLVQRAGKPVTLRVAIR